MPRKPRKSMLKRTLRGVSLLETLLALSIGGVVIASSMFGLARYTENLKVQASASMLNRLTFAADRYAEDNFDALLAAAPQEIPINVLQPYYGQNIGTDAFRSSYRLSTRRYTYQVPDPSGGTRNEDALQVLVVAMQDPNGALQGDESVRADIANTAGAGAGFISTDNLTCMNAAGTGTRVPGNICGAFGSYSFVAGAFPATDFNGNNANPNDGAAYVGLVTKGDSSVYGDQLYRYDFGDPELNTMHTDLLMNDYDIENPRQINGTNLLNFDGGRQAIDTASGDLTIEPADTLVLSPGANTVEITDNGGQGGIPVVHGSQNRLQLGTTGARSWTSLGDRVTRSMHGDDRDVGEGDLYARSTWTEEVRTDQINSLHPRIDDPLRLQKRNNGEVIVGKRVRYSPNGSRYEISDGKLTAQHVQVQDVTCADCGGSLSNLLPRWRHMGTYLISDLASNPSGTVVPKPQCNSTRRAPVNRGATSETMNYREDTTDNRFEQKIIVIPKEFGVGLGANRDVVYSFYATHSGNNWRVYPRAEMDGSSTEAGLATALAATYCVFTGGTSDPAQPNMGALPTGNSAGWTRIEQ